jgi:hypothetical protein
MVESRIRRRNLILVASLQRAQYGSMLRSICSFNVGPARKSRLQFDL